MPKPDHVALATRELIEHKQRLDALYKNYKVAALAVEPVFQGELHKYICIRFAGYLEVLFFRSVDAYVRVRTSEHAGSFALHHWKHAPNLGPEALDKLIGRFQNDSWNNSLENLLIVGERRGSLGTLLKIRNDTAHGMDYKGSLRSTESYKELVDQIHNWVFRNLLS